MIWVVVAKQAQVRGFTGMGCIIRVKHGIVAKQTLVVFIKQAQVVMGLLDMGQIIRVNRGNCT